MTEKVYGSHHGLILTLKIIVKSKIQSLPWYLAKNARWIWTSDILKKKANTGYFQINALAVWFNIFQWNLAHLLSSTSLLSRINPQRFAKNFLKVNWNAETSWSLSQDFEAVKTVSKEFLRNSFWFSRYGPLKSSFLLIRKVSEKGRGNVRSIPRVTRKGAVTSEAIFEFLAS